MGQAKRGPLDVIAEFIERVRESRYRGLLVVTGLDEKTAAGIVELVCSGRGVVVGTGMFKGRCIEPIEPRRLETILGRTTSAALLDTDSPIDANTVAAVTETIEGGGVLVLATRKPWHDWKPLGPRAFHSYFKSKILGARQVLCIDVGTGRIIVERTLNTSAEPPLKPRGIGLPGWLEENIATMDQARALKKLIGLVDEEKAMTILVTGNRGRGKTSLVGLLLGYLVVSRRVGSVAVTAPSTLSVQPLFSILARVLARRGIRYKAWGPKPLYHGVKGGWFKIYYEHPSTAGLTPLTVVDEAAAIGIARVRRITHRSRKTVVTTTLHGYEGSGKAFLHRLLKDLPGPVIIELEEPVRYPRGDPLEEWVYETFMLNAEPGGGPGGGVEHVVVERTLSTWLAEDRDTLRKVYAILVTAHYRNMPNDLVSLLEHDYIVYISRSGSDVAGVAQVRLGDRMLRDILAKQYGVSPPHDIARVVRIAVHPRLQRRGVGSSMLEYIERDLAGHAHWIGAVFSNHDVIGFWLKNGYSVIYISPRFNKVTGEKNVAVVKPLSSEARRALEEIIRDFNHRIVLAGSSVYRDLPAEEITLILSSQSSCPPRRTPLVATKEQLHRLKRFLDGGLYHEAAQDILLLLIAKAAYNCCIGILGSNQLTVIVSAIAQGKPVWDVARIVGVEESELEDIVRRAVEKLVESCVPIREQAE